MHITSTDRAAAPATAPAGGAAESAAASTIESAIGAAARDAAAAAKRSGVTVRPLSGMREFDAAQRLFEIVWNTGPEGTPVTADMLCALAIGDNPIFGAFEGDELIGSAFGFCSPPDTANMHSHIAGVLPRAQGRSVGLALKLQQRAWALTRSIRTMTWTFDPLIRRNAVFNLAKLGAEPVEYFVDLYGDMDDDINRGDPSDRLLVRWHLDRPLPDRYRDPRDDAWGDSDHIAIAHVAIPEDIEALRLQNAERAAEWRLELRRGLGERMAAGDRVLGFDGKGHYLLSPATGA